MYACYITRGSVNKLNMRSNRRRSNQTKLNRKRFISKKNKTRSKRVYFRKRKGGDLDLSEGAKLEAAFGIASSYLGEWNKRFEEATKIVNAFNDITTQEYKNKHLYYLTSINQEKKYDMPALYNIKRKINSGLKLEQLEPNEKLFLMRYYPKSDLAKRETSENYSKNYETTTTTNNNGSRTIGSRARVAAPVAAPVAARVVPMTPRVIGITT